MLPTLETARLSLRLVTLEIITALLDDDLPRFESLTGARYPGGVPVPPLMDDFLPYCRDWLRDHPREDAWTWFGIDRDRRAAVVSGGFGFGPDARGVATLGYSTYRSEEGLGYAAELGGALVDWALTEPAIVAVEATIPVGHVASVRVAERAGLRFDRMGEDAEVGEVLVYRRARELA